MHADFLEPLSHSSFDISTSFSRLTTPTRTDDNRACPRVSLHACMGLLKTKKSVHISVDFVSTLTAHRAAAFLLPPQPQHSCRGASATQRRPFPPRRPPVSTHKRSARQSAPSLQPPEARRSFSTGLPNFVHPARPHTRQGPMQKETLREEKRKRKKKGDSWHLRGQGGPAVPFVVCSLRRSRSSYGEGEGRGGAAFLDASRNDESLPSDDPLPSFSAAARGKRTMRRPPSPH
mmetsp:Transcript_33472/g.66368  ORF Transcript_33472/g.66368 Transcript_33472/m.66368 type:complete len:233 (-) Transcript_33472:549-1247(-)